MQKEINLLPKKHIGFLAQEKTIVIFRVITVFSAIFVLCSFVVIFFLQKNYSLTAIQSQQASVTSKLALLHDKTTKEVALIDRTKKIASILKTRADLVDKISLIQKQAPQDVTIDTLTISKTDVSFLVTSKSLTSLQKFIDALTNLVAKKTLLQKITIDNVVIDQVSGTYSVNIHGVLL